MKRQVQEPGIRRWFGDDWIDMQNEIYSALEGFFEPYGNMIIKGCTISDNGAQWRIAAGLVGLFSPTADEYRICRFPQIDVDDAHSAIYVTLTSENVNRAYKTGGTLAVVKEYKAQISTVQPGSGEYLTINADGNNVTFRNALQSALFRFVTDTEKNTWNAKEPAIVKNTGFNLDKDNSVTSTNVNTLATSAAVKTAYDRGTQGVNDAASALGVANQKLDAGAKAYDSGKLNGLVEQSSITDSNASKLMLVGAFGLGASSGNKASISDANSLLNTGFYTTGSSWIGSPVAGTNGSNQGYLLHIYWGDSYCLQMFFDINSSAFGPKIRRKNNGAWTDWYRLYSESYNSVINASDIIIS